MMRALARAIPLELAAEGAGYYRRMPEGTASLASRRLSQHGLTSRIRVVRKVAYLLEQRGRLRTYRVALCRALASIAEDAGSDHVELRHEAEAYGRELAPLHARSWQGSAGRVRRVVRSRQRRARRLLASAIARAGGPNASAPDREVRDGLETAALAAACDPDAGTVSRPCQPVLSLVLAEHGEAASSGALDRLGPDVEILVVGDDGAIRSPPRSSPRSEPLSAPAAPATACPSLSARRNTGMRAARGRCIAFAEADTALDIDVLEEMAQRLRGSPASIGALVVGEHRSQTGPALASRTLPAAFVVIRREAVATVGFFDDRDPVDASYWLRLRGFFAIASLDATTS